MSEQPTAGSAQFDPSERELCSDGNCLGVVVDGKCNVCGLGAAGQLAPGSDAAEMVAEGGGHPDSGGPSDAAFDDDERRLCADGACTGLVGSDGKCKECGRSS